jgi:CheY-like chemotaxis protein
MAHVSSDTLHDEEFYSPIRQKNFEKASLLVVEDQDDIWEILSYALSKTFPDITVHRTKTRKDTVDYINKAKGTPAALPKLILQDLYLPQPEKGFRLLNDLRVLLGYEQQIPILVISSSMDQKDIQQAYQTGASFYLVKPVSMGQWQNLCQSIRHFWWEQGVLPIY